MYNTRLKNYTLEKLENDNHLNNVTIDWSDISIEHILLETLEKIITVKTIELLC